MRHSRVVARLLALCVGCVLLSTPVAAQSLNRLAIDELNEQLLYVALPLTLFVELTLVYAIYRFRNNENPKPTVDDPALEVTWTAATGAILVFVGISAFFVMANPYVTPAAAGPTENPGDATDEVTIEVLAYQWGYEFYYPEDNRTTDGRLVLPVDQDVRFELASSDVIHSFYIPGLGVKQDVFPGRTTVARTHPTDTGEYVLYCAELCGSGHARMQSQVLVLDDANYTAWTENESSVTAANQSRQSA